MLPLLVDLLPGQHDDTNQETVVVQVEPYTMCSRQECDERIRTNEVSLFERTTIGASPPSSWQLDPCKAICKYRRSAAGCFTDNDSTRAPPRSLAALNTTAAYLVRHILMEGCRRPPGSIGEGNKDSTTTATIPYLSRVAFFEDRLRAVQVDLVRSQVVAPHLQVLAVRTQVLLLYLLADVNHASPAVAGGINKMAYEHSFGQSALQTALSSYSGSTSDFDDIDETETTISNRYDDEITALTLLVQLNQQLMAEQHAVSAAVNHEESNHAATAPLSLTLALADLVRRDSSTHLFGKPRFQWTLRLVSYCSLGFWQTALQSILNGCLDLDNDETFAILARCCLAPSIPYLQWRVLQLYNVTLLKNETMTGAELARTLHVATPRVHPTTTFDDDDLTGETRPSSQAALDVAHVSYGLPLNDSRDAVLFKVQPIQPMPSTTLMRIRDNDSIVLGINHHELYSSCDGIQLPSAEWTERLLFS